MKPSKLAMTVILLVAITGTGCAQSEAVHSFDLKNGLLPECPASPNCVSTQSQDPEKKMDPLPFKGDLEQSRQRILTIIQDKKRTKLVNEQSHSLHFEFKSAVFRFVDDVLFYFDEGSRKIHFRSASRTGSSDMGVNRKRMEQISEQYLDE
jgi:uncharacterized protein (DUF1499 family)